MTFRLRTEVVLESAATNLLHGFQCFRGNFQAYGYTWMVGLLQVPETSFVGLGINFDPAAPSCTGESYENLKRDMYTMTASVLSHHRGRVGGMISTFAFKGSDGHFVSSFCSADRLRDYLFTRETNQGPVLCLRLLFEVERSSGTGEPRGVTAPAAVPPPPPATPRRQHTMSLFDDSSSSDFKIRTYNKKEFSVHRLIVAGQSQGFAKLFEEAKERGDSVIDITDVEPDSMEAVLKYLYDYDMQTICKDFNMVFDLLDAAERYSIKTLIKGCEQYMQLLGDSKYDRVSPMVLVETFVICFRLQLETVQKRLVGSLKRKGDGSIFSSDAFQDFLKNQPDAAAKMFTLMSSP